MDSTVSTENKNRTEDNIQPALPAQTKKWSGVIQCLTSLLFFFKYH